MCFWILDSKSLIKSCLGVQPLVGCRYHPSIRWQCRTQMWASAPTANQSVAILLHPRGSETHRRRGAGPAGSRRTGWGSTPAVQTWRDRVWVSCMYMVHLEILIYDYVNIIFHLWWNALGQQYTINKTYALIKVFWAPYKCKKVNSSTKWKKLPSKGQTPQRVAREGDFFTLSPLPLSCVCCLPALALCSCGDVPVCLWVQSTQANDLQSCLLTHSAGT